MMRLEIPNVFFNILENNLDDLIGGPSKRCRPYWSNGGCPRSASRRQFRHKQAMPQRNANKSTDCPQQSSCCQSQSSTKPQPTTSIVKSDFFMTNIDLRSFEPSEISVKLEENTLVVRGKHEVTSEGQYEFREYVKKISVPEDVLIDQLKSTLDQNGHLLIEAPLKKPEEEKKSGRDIPIEFVKNPQSLDEMALD